MNSKYTAVNALNQSTTGRRSPRVDPATRQRPGTAARNCGGVLKDVTNLTNESANRAQGANKKPDHQMQAPVIKPHSNTGLTRPSLGHPARTGTVQQRSSSPAPPTWVAATAGQNPAACAGGQSSAAPEAATAIPPAAEGMNSTLAGDENDPAPLPYNAGAMVVRAEMCNALADALKSQALESTWTSALAKKLRSLLSLGSYPELEAILKSHGWQDSQFKGPPNRERLLQDLNLYGRWAVEAPHTLQGGAVVTGLPPGQSTGTSAALARVSAPPPPVNFPLRAAPAAAVAGAAAMVVDEVLHGMPDYADEILELLFTEEAHNLPVPNYMEHQRDINGRMRGILVDWLVEVHMKYKLRRETLHLTVCLIDRYLTRMPVMRRRLQLVGVVAMFLAAKFEEISPPEVGDFVYITDRAYLKEDILNMECVMLQTLHFQLNFPTAAHFAARLQHENDCDDTHTEVVHYLLELTLLDISMIRYSPSHIVAAALLLSNELLGRASAWPPRMAELSRYAEPALRQCKEEIRRLQMAAPHNQLQAVYRKYCHEAHHKVARMI
mmetsp:Transcript_12990/g.29473  ORF Transcript_12990/g.29473 Transcript_12990/m.29473 type:complete len:553 (+) Transcript_12990:73-1731(+)